MAAAGHVHGPGHAHARGGAAAPLGLALGLTFCVALLELIGGLVSHSLALLTDSAHVFMDVVALGISVAAATQNAASG